LFYEELYMNYDDFKRKILGTVFSHAREEYPNWEENLDEYGLIELWHLFCTAQLSIKPSSIDKFGGWRELAWPVDQLLLQDRVVILVWNEDMGYFSYEQPGARAVAIDEEFMIQDEINELPSTRYRALKNLPAGQRIALWASDEVWDNATIVGPAFCETT
jgi:hypothetical protein